MGWAIFLFWCCSSFVCAAVARRAALYRFQGSFRNERVLPRRRVGRLSGMTGSSLGMPKSRASLCGSPRRALAGPTGARGPYATGATATTALWSAKRGRARISPRASPREAQFVRRLSPLPPTRKTTKLLVFDLGDARNARRWRWSLRLGGRRRVREARLHF